SDAIHDIILAGVDVPVNDHIRSGVLLGEFLLKLAMTAHCPKQKEDHVIQEPLPDADMPMRQGDPDTVYDVMALQRKTVAHEPVAVALDCIGGCDLGKVFN